ncbi:hypothetical protein PG985_005358 [Apiospora marii]|uniref:uncharacterized protein n=1 Tax=Apiospora marii TaxID=335849 RepID=UPI00312E23A0
MTAQIDPAKFQEAAELLGLSSEQLADRLGVENPRIKATPPPLTEQQSTILPPQPSDTASGIGSPLVDIGEDWGEWTDQELWAWVQTPCSGDTREPLQYRPFSHAQCLDANGIGLDVVPTHDPASAPLLLSSANFGNIDTTPPTTSIPVSSDDWTRSEASSTTTSSWAITTPTSSSNRTSDDSDIALVSQEEVAGYADDVATLGPCSRVWNIPKRTRRRKTNKKTEQRREKSLGGKDGQKGRRGPYTDDVLRSSTALTRSNRGCCFPNPVDLKGECLTCKNMRGPTLSKMPCLRYKITDAMLYREQETPYRIFTSRWKNLDIVDIDEWASDDIKIVEISQNFLDAPYKAKVREFIPVEGDALEERWESNGCPRSHPIPRYGLADMHEVAEMMKGWTDRNIFTYICGAVGGLDDFFWETYMMAFRHPVMAKVGSASFTQLPLKAITKTEEERSLIWDCFRLWIACRLTSNPCHLYGKEKLGGQIVDDPESPHYNRVPMPCMIIAQMECILYTTILRPKSSDVLRRLNNLVLEKKRENWLTIYLVMFILLHNCAMITRRDEETATNYGHKERYANPNGIYDQHRSVQAMLAHFHFINKGVLPFSLPANAAGRAELQRAADLNDEQVDFVWRTSELVKQRFMKNVRERDLVGNDLFWVSFLYDDDWRPRAND